MKIAVISDIHGNLPALEAVIDDMKNQKVDQIICLGDMVGKGPSSKEVIDICREECDIILEGNWERFLYEDYAHVKNADISPGPDNELSKRSQWYIDQIGTERMEYLNSLPHLAELYVSGKLIRLFHAHPTSFNRYYADSPIEKRLELLGYPHRDTAFQKQSDIAIYADIHNAYMQDINGSILLNVGSVGNPLDIPQSSYIILEGEKDSEADSRYAIQWIRVPYDIEKAVSIARASGQPDLDEYIIEITTAQYCKRK